MRRLALTAVLVCGPALGQSAPTTGTLDVRARIVSGCRISGHEQLIENVDFGLLAFGTWPSIVSTPITAQAQGPAGTIQLECIGVLSADIAIGIGLNPDGAQRQLASDANRVPYDLYADTGFGEPFTSTAPRTVSISPDGDAATVTMPIYGKVDPAVGGYPPGQYQDVVQITVSW